MNQAHSLGIAGLFGVFAVGAEVDLVGVVLLEVEKDINVGGVDGVLDDELHVSLDLPLCLVKKTKNVAAISYFYEILIYFES